MFFNTLNFDKYNKTMYPMSTPMHLSMNYSMFGNQNWMSVYTTNLEHNLLAKENQKMNVVFKTIRGATYNIIIDFDKTISELIQIFFKRLGKEELFYKNDYLFIYNGRKLEYNDKTKVADYFRCLSQPTINANEVSNLIGALIFNKIQYY